MTSLQALFTSEGQTLTEDANINGRYIDIQGFGISENTGTFDDTRNIDNIETMWVNLPISGTININPTTQQLNLTIPPNVVNPFGVINTSNKEIKELYLFGIQQKEIFTVDVLNNELIVTSQFYDTIETGHAIRFFTSGVLPISSPAISSNKTFYVIKSLTANRVKIATTKVNALAETAIIFSGAGTGIHKIARYFLFALGQFQPEPLVWVYTGALTLRIQLVIANLNFSQTIQFSYTQAQEIKDHNIDPNAHPAILSALEYFGCYVNPLNWVYKGQTFYKDAVFHNTVASEMIVYKKTSDNKFHPALAVAGEQSKVVGIGFLDDKTVRASGIIQINHSIPINSDVYLSSTVAGAVTSSVTTVKLGRSLGNNLILWQYGLSGSGGANFLDDLTDVGINTPQNKHVLVYDSGTSLWKNQYLNLADLGTVSFGTLTDKQGLIYNDTSGVWENKDIKISDGHIKDIVLTSPTNGQILKKSGANWVNINFGITIQSNSFIETVVFGSGFNVTTPSAGAVTINYTGTGSPNFTGLTDVPDSYPTNDVGLVAYNNLTANVDPNKVTFISNQTDITDPVFASPDGLIYLPVFKSVANFIQEYPAVPDFPLTKDTLLNLTKVYQVGATGVNDFKGIAWTPSALTVQGSGITGLVSGNNNYAFNINFGSGLSGSYNPITASLTINSTVASGLTSVEKANNSYGNRPLVFDTGTGGVAKIRNLQEGNNIELKMFDSSNNPTNDINSAIMFRVSSIGNISNISNSGGLGSLSAVVVNGVQMPVKSPSSGNYSLQARGIRGINGINVRLETSGSNENVIIDGSGISGGGSGLTLGSSSIVTGTFGLGMETDSGKIGYAVGGTGTKTGTGYRTSNNYLGYTAEFNEFGVQIDNCTNGVWLGGNSLKPLTLAYYGTGTLSTASPMESGTIIHGNFNSQGQGFYTRIGGNLYKFNLSLVGVIP